MARKFFFGTLNDELFAHVRYLAIFDRCISCINCIKHFTFPCIISGIHFFHVSENKNLNLVSNIRKIYKKIFF